MVFEFEASGYALLGTLGSWSLLFVGIKND
jgi:hypothetical protein